jgi:osmoprotectant transport system permease protein
LKYALAFATCLFLSVGLISSAHAGDPLRVGSKRFTESYVLGELITLQAQTTGSAQHLAGLGNTAIVLSALQSGAIDVYPEYTGTIAREILKKPELVTLQDLKIPLQELGLGVSVPLGFTDGYAIAVSASTAQRLNLHSLGDLKNHPDIRLGLSAEFLQRSDGWPMLAKTYDLKNLTPRSMDHGMAYDALTSGIIEGIDAYTTDARVEKEHLVLLQDELKVLPPYAAVLLYRLEVPQQHPKEWGAIAKLENTLSEAQMRSVNAMVDLDHATPAAAAQALRQTALDQNSAKPVLVSQNKGLWTRSLELMFSAEEGRLIVQHLILVIIPVLAAAMVGIPLGVAGATFPHMGRVCLSVVGLLQTIPALALLALLIALINQIGTVPALITLFFYAMLPIVESTQSAFENIDRHLRESAIALGAPWFKRTWYVELPIARSGIISGIRTAAVINVGGATLAAFVGGGGLGERIVGGLAVNDPALLIAGAVPAAVLALAIQLLMGRV